MKYCQGRRQRNWVPVKKIFGTPPPPPRRADRLKIFTPKSETLNLICRLTWLGPKRLICKICKYWYYRDGQKYGQRAGTPGPPSDPPRPGNLHWLPPPSSGGAGCYKPCFVFWNFLVHSSVRRLHVLGEISLDLRPSLYPNDMTTSETNLEAVGLRSFESSVTVNETWRYASAVDHNIYRSRVIKRNYNPVSSKSHNF
jgi:hypothetical protein